MSDSSSKIVELVVIPLILLSAIVVLLNQKPSTTYSWLSSHAPTTLHSESLVLSEAEHRLEAAPPPAPAAAPKVMENEEENNSKPVGSHKKASNLEMVEASLAQARAIIHHRNETLHDPDYTPTGSMYRNPKTFHRSYLEMEKLFKIYVYEEGDPPLFHYSRSLGVLGIEGILMHQIEISKFRTRDPKLAHVFFVPMSVQSMWMYSYVRWAPLHNIAKDYVELISTKYPYWNRTRGHDHFILACHDWAPSISRKIPNLYKNSIRVLCNANTSEGFKPSIDVSMPEIHLPGGTMKDLIGGPSPSKRSVLVFYAGGVHGYIREVLMEHWKNNTDPDVQIHEYLPKKVSYYGMVRKSKYCICPSGWEVASPRTVEALYMGCVPVLLKDHYSKPFDDVLDWSTFSVDVQVDEIPNLKKILMSIPQRRYIKMQKTGILVRRHFEVNFPPKRYDVFHMILHSIWLRRLNVKLSDTDESDVLK